MLLEPRILFSAPDKSQDARIAIGTMAEFHNVWTWRRKGRLEAGATKWIGAGLAGAAFRCCGYICCRVTVICGRAA